eukprot:5455394-Alexandrium_andersonii.AAC.1
MVGAGFDPSSAWDVITEGLGSRVRVFRAVLLGNGLVYVRGVPRLRSGSEARRPTCLTPQGPF